MQVVFLIPAKTVCFLPYWYCRAWRNSWLAVSVYKCTYTQQPTIIVAVGFIAVALHDDNDITINCKKLSNQSSYKKIEYESTRIKLIKNLEEK